MPEGIRARLQSLRMALLTRLRFARGSWRRGQTRIESPRLVPGLHGQRTWRYVLFTPAGMRDDETAPLIVLLHGCHQRALRFAEASGWTLTADRRRFRLLCPEQRRLSNLLRCWNWFDPRAQRGQGEIQVVLAMIEQVSHQVAIAPGAVAAVGLSAGGALAALLGMHYPSRFAAVAAVAAPPLIGGFGPQTPRQVMQHGLARDPATALGAIQHACAPMLILHGTADAVVNPRCAIQLADQALETWRRARIETRRLDPDEGAHDPATDHLAGDRLVLRQVRVDGLAHAWTGGPGGHPYCERGGKDLTAACMKFLRDCGFPGA